MSIGIVSAESMNAELVGDTIPSTLGSRAELHPRGSQDEEHRDHPRAWDRDSPTAGC